ncbi:TetR/AcrR family transcriptional regulator [Candidatus Poriferisodalis sp.]|uniref:TetR/AcrR family transcriptional regulator n=1 Tax=Candidatus Poriferisodalis sp. TaxID=3101277 RepID=UPI003B5CB9C2
MSLLPNSDSPVPAETASRSRGPEEVTERLLNSAITVFSERGFESATVSDIARTCGLTTGAIYARWPTKRELFTAVIEHTSAQRMLLLIKDAEATTAEKLTMLGATLFISTRDDTRNLWIEACVSASREPSLHPAVAQCQEAEAGDLAEIVAEGKASGVIDPSLSTDAVVFLCQSLSLGTYLAMRVQAEERGRPTDDDWSEIVARLIRAIRPGH